MGTAGPYAARFAPKPLGRFTILTFAGASVKPQPKNSSQRELAANPTPANSQKLLRLTARLDAHPNDDPQQTFC
jgi:hypothetical protein